MVFPAWSPREWLHVLPSLISGVIKRPEGWVGCRLSWVIDSLFSISGYRPPSLLLLN